MIAAGYALVFFYAPLDADQGFIQKIFYLHVPLATVALVGFIVGGVYAIRTCAPATRSYDARSYVVDPHLGDLRRRGPAHRLDLGQGLLGRLVGVGRADPGQLPDRLPALRDLLPAPLRDRGPRPPGPLRVGLRDHRRRLRAAQLPRRPPRAEPRPPAHLRDRRAACPASMLLTFLVCLAGDGAAVGDAGRSSSTAKAPRRSSRACAARSRATARAPAPETSRIAPGVAAECRAECSPTDARAAARRGGQVRRRRLRRLPRAAPDLRRDHGREARADRARAARAGRASPSSARAPTRARARRRRR